MIRVTARDRAGNYATVTAAERWRSTWWPRGQGDRGAGVGAGGRADATTGRGGGRPRGPDRGTAAEPAAGAAGLAVTATRRLHSEPIGRPVDRPRGTPTEPPWNSACRESNVERGVLPGRSTHRTAGSGRPGSPRTQSRPVGGRAWPCRRSSAGTRSRAGEPRPRPTAPVRPARSPRQPTGTHDGHAGRASVETRLFREHLELGARIANDYVGGRSLIHHLADPDWKPSMATPDSCRWEPEPDKPRSPFDGIFDLVIPPDRPAAPVVAGR